MAHIVKCVFCGKQFDRDKIEFVQMGSRRYAHRQCNADDIAQEDKVQEDRERLVEYLKKLFDVDNRLNPVLNSQLKKFREQFNYTDVGILKALKYFYEVRGQNSTQKFSGIGIVPYVYDEAQKYYYNLFLIRQKNAAKPVEQFRRVERTINIPVPTRQDKRKRRLFTFIEEED